MRTRARPAGLVRQGRSRKRRFDISCLKDQTHLERIHGAHRAGRGGLQLWLEALRPYIDLPGGRVVELRLQAAQADLRLRRATDDLDPILEGR